jgi:RNA polymerase primary sigma factor
MATKTKAKATQKENEKEKVKDEAPEKETPETPDAPLPLLDLSDAAVKKLIRSAKKRGYVTVDQINARCPRRGQFEQSRTFSPCSARWASMWSKPGGRAGGGAPRDRGQGAGTRAIWSRSSRRCRPRPRPRSRPSVPTTRYACTCAKWARWTSVAPGEIAIAKRLEAGREADLRWRRPAHVQAIIIWRDELNEQSLPARYHRPRSNLCGSRRQGIAAR